MLVEAECAEAPGSSDAAAPSACAEPPDLPDPSEFPLWCASYSSGGLISKNSSDGSVYEARSHNDERACILKFVYSVRHSDSVKNLREVQILRSIGHPNVVRLLGAFQA